MCSYPSTLHFPECLQSVQVIVFDLDDTLYSEHEYVHSGFRAVSAFLKAEGIVRQDVSDAMWSLFAAGERNAVFNRVLENFGVEPAQELIDRLIGVYRSHQPQIALFTDACAVLDYFHRRRTLALLTDGYTQTQAAKVFALGIADYFEVVVLTDQLGRDCWKPSPVGFEKIMHTLGGSPTGYVYIADNPLKDFAAPRRLGWMTLHVRRPGGVYADTTAPEEGFEADVKVEDLYQAARLLDPDFRV
jgi:putative hydrolase of the HAD superfamily